MLKRYGNTTHGLESSLQRLDKNGCIASFIKNKKGFSALFTKKAPHAKSSHSGGRLLKSFLRHGRIVQKPMQAKKRKKDLSSCKSYTWTKKKAAIERMTQLIPKKQFGWMYSFAIIYVQ